MIGKRKRQLVSDYKTLFESDAGERVLADLANRGCVFRSTHSPGDSHHTAWSEGARAIVLHIIDMADKDLAYLRDMESKRKRAARQNAEGMSEDE